MLTLSNDLKTRFYKAHKNTFGLLPGPEHTCPCATEGEGGCWEPAKAGSKLKTCYAQRLCVLRVNVRKSLEHNTIEIKSVTDKKTTLQNMFSSFETSVVKWAIRNKKDPKDYLYFRLHWSGDLFDAEYTRALAEAMDISPKITFWGYTRSFDFVPILAGVRNLVLYLSLDRQNIEKGLQCYNNNPWTRISWLDVSNDICKQGYTKWPESVKLTACPADTNKIPKEGSCAHCKICLGPKKTHVWFKTR